MPFQTKYTLDVQVVDNSHSTFYCYLTSVLMYMWNILKAWLNYSILDDILARIYSSCAAHHVSFTAHYPVAAGQAKNMLESVTIRSLSTVARYPSIMAFLARWFSFFLAVVACLQGSTATVFPDLYEASVLELQQGLDAGTFSSVDLVKVLTFL